jgi:hypothetical protein
VKKLTERSAKWVAGVLAKVEANTGRSLDAWVSLAKKARVKDAKEARQWGKAQGLSIVYQTMVADALYPSTADDDDLVAAQYSGPKAAMRPTYDAVVAAARKLGADVEVMARTSQVTLSRATSFAVVRAATRTRVDLALKLHGEPGTERLVKAAKAAKSDPSHVVGLTSPKDVDKELVGWMRQAYARASGTR